MSVYFVYERKYFFRTLTRLCRDVNRFEIIHKLQIFGKLSLKFVYGVGVLFYQIPLVHYYERRFTLLVNEAYYFGILFGKPFRAVHNE